MRQILAKNRHMVTKFVILSIISVLASTCNKCNTKSTKEEVIDVYFSPNGQCTETIVKEINKASSTILIQAYSFTSTRIVDALINAAARGVTVKCIIDKMETECKGNVTKQLYKNISDLAIDSQCTLCHSKVMIIDNKTVITGSFNFTEAAEFRNVENLVLIRDPLIVKKYLKHWEERRALSNKYTKELRKEIKKQKDAKKRFKNRNGI